MEIKISLVTSSTNRKLKIGKIHKGGSIMNPVFVPQPETDFEVKSGICLRELTENRVDRGHFFLRGWWLREWKCVVTETPSDVECRLDSLDPNSHGPYLLFEEHPLDKRTTPWKRSRCWIFGLNSGHFSDFRKRGNGGQRHCILVDPWNVCDGVDSLIPVIDVSI